MRPGDDDDDEDFQEPMEARWRLRRDAKFCWLDGSFSSASSLLKEPPPAGTTGAAVAQREAFTAAAASRDQERLSLWTGGCGAADRVAGRLRRGGWWLLHGERLWWVVHNLVAHPAIALVPCATTFRWHDETARRMRVRGWV